VIMKIDDKTLDRLLSSAKRTSPDAWVPTRLTPKQVRSLVSELKTYREALCEYCGAQLGTDPVMHKDCNDGYIS